MQPMPDNETGVQSVGNDAHEVRVVDGGHSSGAPTPILTLESLQRYVESERSRTRHALLWTSTLFLFVVLLVLILFVSVGINVLRRTRRTSSLVQNVRIATEVHSAKLEGMEDSLKQMTDINAEIKTTVDNSEQQRVRRERLVRSNLERFGDWVEKRNAREMRALQAMEARLREMEDRSDDREDELSLLKEKYAGLQVALTQATVVVQQRAPEPDAFAVAEAGGARPDLPEDAKRDAGPEEMPGRSAEDVAEESFPDDWLETELASAEDLILEEIGALEGSSRQEEISVVTFPNGDRYEGGFRDGLFDGWGVYYYHNGDRYEGTFSGDMKNGRGTYTYNNGDKFIGEFGNDMRHGRGSMMYMTGDRYIGEFSDDMKNGKGTMIYETGNKYAGNFMNGLKHGNGVFRFNNGDVYKGEYREDLRYGKGTYLYAGGSKYIGDFVEGSRHGKGRYIYEGGEEYIGEFKSGRKDGHGVCIYPNGLRLKGLWKQDKFVRRLD